MTSSHPRCIAQVTAFGCALVLLAASPSRGDSAILEPIFADDFEDGSVCAWISQVPSLCAGGMVFVPAGEFTMGSFDGSSAELPVHLANLSAYWIDRNDVTVDEYASCVTAGGCPPPNMSYPDVTECNAGSPRSGDNPINCVDWFHGQAYCAWAGKRYPTEAEWEKAARGTDGRTYPWGAATPTCHYAVMNEFSAGGSGCGSASTLPVGSRPAGASPYGALDMAGNVWQWVNDWYSPTYYSVSPPSNPPGPATGTAKVVRGGYWNTMFVTDMTVSYRASSSAANWGTGYGFRCARDG